MCFFLPPLTPREVKSRCGGCHGSCSLKLDDFSPRLQLSAPWLGRSVAWHEGQMPMLGRARRAGREDDGEQSSRITYRPRIEGLCIDETNKEYNRRQRYSCLLQTLQLPPSNRVDYCRHLWNRIMAKTSSRSSAVSLVMTSASSLSSLLYLPLPVAPVPFLISPSNGPHLKASSQH